MQDAGVRAPAPYGIATLTPEREYLIVTEFLDGAVELTEAEVDSEVVDDCLSLVRTMWDHGLAHRDVKPSNVMVRDRQGYLIDAAFGQMRPSPWREAVDLANMMLSLALRSTSELVYERALLQFSTDEIAEAFSVTRGVTLPSQLRRELKNDPRDLVAEFRALGPPRPQVPVQRWSPRRLGLTAVVLVVVVAGLVLGVGNLEGIGLL
jgi:serine/threonine protein kinase